VQDSINNQSSIKPSLSLATLRQRLINHILWIKTYDVEYARYTARHYNDLLPWLGLTQGLREAIEAEKVQGVQDIVHTT
jgi:hypothetical protein